MNRFYDLEHVCTGHSRMSQAELAGRLPAGLRHGATSLEHIETLLRRAVADGLPATRLMLSLVVFCGMQLVEKIHPLQGGYIRRRIRLSRRPGMPREFAPLFHVRHWASTAVKLGRLGALLWRVNRIGQRIEAEHAMSPYTDLAITRLAREAEVNLEMLQERPLLEAARRSSPNEVMRRLS